MGCFKDSQKIKERWKDISKEALSGSWILASRECSDLFSTKCWRRLDRGWRNFDNCCRDFDNYVPARDAVNNRLVSYHLQNKGLAATLFIKPLAGITLA